MTILKDISVLWSLLHTLVMFALLFESRYPRRKTVVLTLSTMLPLLIVNFLLYLLADGLMFIVMLATCVLPSLIFFWVLAKHRDGRFIFTFCLSDTMWLEVIYITNILDFYFGDKYIFMFVSRLLLYPLLELLIYKKIRPAYLKIQKNVTSGWYTFAAISAIFYVMTVLSMSYPTMIMERPEYLPAFVLQLILLPVIYNHIFATLARQQKIFEMTEQEHILNMQVSSLTTRMEELNAADKKFREERHNFRHKLKTIASLLETEEYDECRKLLEEYGEAIEKTKLKRYCKNTVIDALLSAYLQKAARKGIKVDFGFAFPDVIPMNETELATAIANALENAINACEKLPREKRWIEIKVLEHPSFIIRISNSFDGNVTFDENEIPVSSDDEHGYGTRFIAAFCDKYKGYYQFKAKDDVFALYLNF